MSNDDRLRDMDDPEVLGYAMDSESLTPCRTNVDIAHEGDYGADPIGNGMFQMVPSGDVVNLEKKRRRLE